MFEWDGAETISTAVPLGRRSGHNLAKFLAPRRVPPE
jgi:hypothetical protein